MITKYMKVIINVSVHPYFSNVGTITKSFRVSIWTTRSYHAYCKASSLEVKNFKSNIICRHQRPDILRCQVIYCRFFVTYVHSRLDRTSMELIPDEPLLQFAILPRWIVEVQFHGMVCDRTWQYIHPCTLLIERRQLNVTNDFSYHCRSFLCFIPVRHAGFWFCLIVILQQHRCMNATRMTRTTGMTLMAIMTSVSSSKRKIRRIQFFISGESMWTTQLKSAQLLSNSILIIR